MRLGIVASIALIGWASCLSKSDRKTRKKSGDSQENEGVKKQDVIRADSLRFPPQSVSKETIVRDEESVDFGDRTFEQPALAYITPWNNRGYDLAKWTSRKLTHVSPVWLQLKPQSADMAESCRILGTHDIDHGWMSEVRANNSAVKIVPRVLFDDWPMEEMAKFLNSEAWARRCLNDLINFLQRNQFDGAVVELWMSIMAATKGAAAPYLIELLNSWGDGFHNKDMELIVPVGPPLDAKNKETGMFSAAFLQSMARSVDYVQVMTYDFPGGGGVAPFEWVEKSIDVLTQGSPLLASRLMIGINHYGYHYAKKGAEAVTRERFLKELKRDDAELEWDEAVSEHRLTFKDSVIYYPSLTSVEMRLALAKKHGVGVGIWDLGQGLNYFSQLL